MKFYSAQELARIDTSAPALSRGIAILGTLAQDGPQNLEQLSSEMSLPKASVFRLLDTLAKIGIVRKTSDKRYESLYQLLPLDDPMAQFRQALEPKMEALCQTTDSTIEWYEPSEAGMHLILQRNPDRELCVKAEPGFLRDWDSEFEAVARLGAAFAPDAPKVESTQAYTSNGVLENLNASDIESFLKDARDTETAHDLAFNTNGVRRAAVAAFDAKHQFLGVLALAEVYHFNTRNLSRDYLKQLKATLK
ncbi:helix-turn-helix domain-containing protein [Coraliomargarita parva]|uniref:helix-turn-helix domain-containing protein n=1 Tax=Coraliomargarita parva TaxID=3014050 RepID=UPI0022B2C56F|nr:helix-turn-helix domain-containing protein [Coraliomargarita parva]